MSASAKPVVTPPPVFARRQVKPQYLAPGQHLKVASRKPPSANTNNNNNGACSESTIPRDPWEAQDKAAAEGRRRGSSDCEHKDDMASDVHTPSAPPVRCAAASAGPHTPGGHPFSSRLSRSRSRVDSEASASGDTPADTPQQQHQHQQHTDPARCAEDAPISTAGVGAAQPAVGTPKEEEDEEDYYHTTTAEGPTLTAVERAQRVLDMQHQALEAKQLKALTEQGIARRPKTLVRNRHGRLQAITVAGSAASPEINADDTPRIEDAPATMRARPRRPAKAGKKTAVKAVSVPLGDDLVDSRPSTPTEGGPARLEIDFD